MKRRKEKKLLERNGYDIHAIKFLFDHESFKKTVETIFNFSFLIKTGEARIQVNNEGLSVRAINNAGNKPADKQAVIAFTMKDWRELCRAYKREEEDLPDRPRKVPSEVFVEEEAEE